MRYCNVKTSDANRKWLDDRIEAYLDDELDHEERLRFEQLLDEATDIRQELTYAINIRDELRAIPTPDIPLHLEKAILKEIRKDAWQDFRTRFGSGFAGELWHRMLHPLRPVLATFLVLVAATVFLFVMLRPNGAETVDETISQAEVDQALLEAKWALGYVSQTGRLASNSMQDALGPLLKERTKE